MHVSRNIGRDKAIALGKTKWWEKKSFREIAEFQLFVAELCMPFDKFHDAVEHALGRPVFTHEFGLNYDGIVAEFLGNRSAPTLEEIIDMIPEEKRVVLFASVIDTDT